MDAILSWRLADENHRDTEREIFVCRIEGLETEAAYYTASTPEASLYQLGVASSKRQAALHVSRWAYFIIPIPETTDTDWGGQSMNATDKLQATVRTLGIKTRIMSALTPNAKEAGSDNEIEIWQAYRVSEAFEERRALVHQKLARKQ